MSASNPAYVLSRAAQTDIEKIFDYTAHEFGERQAMVYLQSMEEKIKLLVSQPSLGRHRDEIKKGLRSLNFEKHVIFYRMLKENLRVVRVLHGKQDIPRQFFRN